MCLLERINPEYFERDEYKYKWTENLEGQQNASDLMSIDPGGTQDFTSLYSPNGTTLLQDMTKLQPEDASAAAEIALPDLESASIPSRSAESSPEFALRPVAPQRCPSATSVFDLDIVGEVNQIFDWEEACAALVDDHGPHYKADLGSSSSAYPGRSMSLTSEHLARQLELSQSYQQRSESPQSPAVQRPRSATAAQHGPEQVKREVGVEVEGEDEDEGPLTTCHNCRVTKTPLWRRTPDKRHSLCNACGLYLKQYSVMRPLGPRVRSQAASKKDEEPPVCANCEATKTSLWRKDEHGQIICNACGLYHKLHGKARPVTMRKEKISRRKRYRNLPPEEGDEQARLPMDPPSLIPQHSLPSSPQLAYTPVQT